ncbi:PAS domain-containing protein [Streptomyces mirabilis]|uniref:PAS domain-containing protein n=1 Tax=Streptomyces mirabilis TaxID=68239 RepID=UPI0036698215
MKAAPVVVDAAAPEDFAVVIDIRGAVMAWSTGAGRLLGYEPEVVVGRPPTCSPQSSPSRCGATRPPGIRGPATWRC